MKNNIDYGAEKREDINYSFISCSAVIIDITINNCTLHVHFYFNVFERQSLIILLDILYTSNKKSTICQKSKTFVQIILLIDYFGRMYGYGSCFKSAGYNPIVCPLAYWSHKVAPTHILLWCNRISRSHATTLITSLQTDQKTNTAPTLFDLCW